MPLVWLGVVTACNSSTGPGHAIHGKWIRSDNNDTTWFEQNGNYVAGWWVPGGIERVICGSISGNTLKLTFAPYTTHYQGSFSGTDVIEGTYTDTAGVGHALNYTRVVADTPTLLGIGAQCTGFPYGRVISGKLAPLAASGKPDPSR